MADETSSRRTEEQSPSAPTTSAAEPSGGGGVQPMPDAEAVSSTTTAAAAQRQDGSDRVSTIIAVVVWILVLGIPLLLWLRSDIADVLLDVALSQSLDLGGTVMFQGAPVQSGTVHLVVEEARSRRYLASMAVVIDTHNGTFHASLQPPAATHGVNLQLRIAAQFRGQAQADKPDKPARRLTGESTVFLNLAPPLAHGTLWVALGLLVVLTAGLMLLFTSDLTRGKARLLFGITYFMTFVSLAVPITVTILVSQNVYLVEMMEAAPIGLVKGTAKGVSVPQWLVNIGGAVRQPPPGASLPPAAPSRGGDTSSGGEVALPLAVVAPLARGVSVEGGLAVPFYVVFLAMLGAGINMTIQVPKIQHRHAIAQLPPHPTSAIMATLQAPVRMFASSETLSPDQALIVTGIRMELISNYMYLLSAPFLAIAMYYLLQVVATNTSEPVLVLMSFATGLISDRIVSGIIMLARDVLPEPGTQQRERERGGEERGGEESPSLRRAATSGGATGAASPAAGATGSQGAATEAATTDSGAPGAQGGPR